MFLYSEISRKLLYKIFYNKLKREQSLKFLYQIFIYLNNIDKKKICILATTTKTGTHFLRLMLAKYIELLFTDDNTSDELLIDNYFPNSWHSSYTFGKKFIQPFLKNIKSLYLEDIPRSHMPLNYAWNRSKVIHTFRNPLDQSVISFFTKYNLEKTQKFESPYHLFLETYQSIIFEYESFLKNKNFNNVLRISFESLLGDPITSLKSIIFYLGIKHDNKLLEKSVEFASSFNLARLGAFEKWQRSGMTNINEQKDLNNFINTLEKFKCPEGINSYKYFFSEKEQDHCINLIKADSKTMARLYFP